MTETPTRQDCRRTSRRGVTATKLPNLGGKELEVQQGSKGRARAKESLHGADRHRGWLIEGFQRSATRSARGIDFSSRAPFKTADFAPHTSAEIDPMIGATAFRQAEPLTMESARSGQIVNGNSEVERKGPSGLSPHPCGSSPYTMITRDLLRRRLALSVTRDRHEKAKAMAGCFCLPGASSKPHEHHRQPQTH